MARTLSALIGLASLAVLRCAAAEDVTFLFYPPTEYSDGAPFDLSKIYTTWVECSYDGGQGFFYVADPPVVAGLNKITVTFPDRPWTYLCHARVTTKDFDASGRVVSDWSPLLTVTIPQAQAAPKLTPAAPTITTTE